MTTDEVMQVHQTGHMAMSALARVDSFINIIRNTRLDPSYIPLDAIQRDIETARMAIAEMLSSVNTPVE